LPQGDKDNPVPLSREIATLEARLAQQKQAYAKRPRINFIDSVSAVAAYEALYINAFREEVEAVGTRNFPPEALKNSIFGNVRLRVDILPNGHVAQIKLLHSSGHTLLDQAAMRSVRLAAPFAPFTKEMRKHYDILAIIRTWKFDATSTVTSSYDN
jgi:protein TonB